MELYFSPMACSLASRIALYEADAKDAQFIEVDPKTKRTPDGANYFDIYPLGLVPLLRLGNKRQGEPVELHERMEPLGPIAR